MKPRIYIEVRPGRDFAGRSQHLWQGVNPFNPAMPIGLGAVFLFSLEETVASYKKKLAKLQRKARA